MYGGEWHSRSCGGSYIADLTAPLLVSFPFPDLNGVWKIGNVQALIHTVLCFRNKGGRG